MIITKGKYYKLGNRRCLVGHSFKSMGIWQYKVIYINNKGYVTGTDCLYFIQPDVWVEIEPILIRKRDRLYVEEVMEVPIGFYSSPSNKNTIAEKKEVIDMLTR